MDCNTVADRVAAYLDNELSRSEQQLFERHLEGCEACQRLVEAVSDVDLSPPPPPPEVGEPGFWDRMDVALAAEQARVPELAPVAPPPAANRLWARRLNVSLPVIFAYVAFLALAVGWSLINLDRAQDAEAALQNMEQLVQREQRQNQPPSTKAVPATESKIVSFRSSRGTF